MADSVSARVNLHDSAQTRAVKAGTLRDEIFDEEFDAVAEARNRCGNRCRRGAFALAKPRSREPRRKSVAAMRHRSFAQEQIMPLAGAETKNRTFMQ